MYAKSASGANPKRQNGVVMGTFHRDSDYLFMVDLSIIRYSLCRASPSSEIRRNEKGNVS
jgi:hypothetical protein